MAEWYLKSIEQVVAELGSDLKKGLSSEEVRHRLERFGRNELKEQGVMTPWAIFLSQFTSVLIIMLLVACAISVLLGEFIDSVAICAIVLLNAILGFVQEFRAERTMQALKLLAVPKVRVRRDGHIMEVSARELVPGDIAFLEAGVHIPADGRLIEAVNLRVSEATLTGESEPVEKGVAECKAPGAGISERNNMVYMGTTVLAGRGAMVVTTTGMRTELGRIAAMLGTVRREQTPLQKRLERLSKELALAVLVIVGIIFVLGVVRGNNLKDMFLIAVSLAVAAVPEGLPAVVTITQTLGARRMLNRNALIRRLNAVETLGSVTVICADKTGTLTENKMTVTMLDVAGDRLDLTIADSNAVKVLEGPSGQALVLLIAGGVLCNDAVLEQENDAVRVIGDPTEGALILAGVRFGLNHGVLHELLPRVGEVPFSSERKRMSTVHRLAGGDLTVRTVKGNELLLLRTLEQIGVGDGRFIWTKGAVDVLLDLSSSVFVGSGLQPLNQEWRQRIIDGHDSLTKKGMRVLGVAFRPLRKAETDGCAEILEKELCFVGMIGMLDPARPEVKDAVQECRRAGIRPVMITGDHPLTAMYIATDIGIETPGKSSSFLTGADLGRMSVPDLQPLVTKTNVYARVAPEHKLNIVLALQGLGEVVAMTGDGVNDAPALKKADIGIAMGITGTDVAKQAAEMVLLDDNFATIVAAVKQGRAIYDNIKKFIRYTLASNAGEIIVMLIAPFFGIRFALTPLQILWINLVTDGLPGLALGVEAPERDVMRRPPRPLRESIFASGMAFNIIWSGVLLGLVSFLPGWWAWRNGNPAWQTIIFTILTMGQLFQSLALRSQRESVWALGLLRNRTLIGAFVITLILQLGLLYLPLGQTIFKTRSLPVHHLLIILILSTTVFWAVELEKFIRRKCR